MSTSWTPQTNPTPSNYTSISSVTPSSWNSLSLTGYTIASVPYLPLSLSSSAVSLTLSDDEVSSAITLPFSFIFFGQTYSTIYISSNGYIGFNSTNMNSNTTVSLPKGYAPFTQIYGLFSDLYPPGGGSIKYETRGVSGSRIFIVEYNSIPFFIDDSFTTTYQIQLFESDSHIEIHTTSLPLISGIVSDITLNNYIGKGYQNGDVLTVLGGNNEFFVEIGNFNSYTWNSGGVGYSVGVPYNTSGGSGTGATVIVNSVFNYHQTQGIENQDATIAFVPTGRNNIGFSLTNDGIAFYPPLVFSVWNSSSKVVSIWT